MPSPRPLSPHLQVYKLPLTGLISITHRITGVCLSLGLVLLTAILIALACGAETYVTLQSLLALSIIKLIYAGFLFALFFHLCHGVRHLIWDTGNSFDKATLFRYALVELAAALLLTLAAIVWHSR